jgi:hypothetical protein
VVPYRRCGPPGDAGAGVPITTASDEPVVVERRVEPGAVTIVDLTAMWAGPLCSLLLATWGARVVTIESQVRPDGLRGQPGQFAALDRGKQRLDVDLRTASGRAEFERLVDEADVVLESFSRRVMANFGYSPGELRERNPRVATVSIRAFPAASAERDWLGYGRGAHAASGLGMLGDRPQRARFAYPDPIVGFAAFATVLDLLGRDLPPSSAEVSLAGSIAPLTTAGERPLGTGDVTLLDRLRAAVGTRPVSPIVRRPR